MDKAYRGVTYFQDRESARVICAEILGRRADQGQPAVSRFDPLYGSPANSIGTRYPQARIVDYTRGYAVQYYHSGPYYPELEV